MSKAVKDLVSAREEIRSDLHKLFELYTVPEVSEICGVSIQSAYTWKRGDGIPRADVYKVIVDLLRERFRHAN